MQGRGFVWQLAVALIAAAAAERAPAEQALTPLEIRRILSHGPWPPPVPRDPSNQVSGQRAAIELGRRLFFDARMSPSGYIACVTCHQVDRGYTDTKARAHGLADLDRNAPSVLNTGGRRWFGWDGASDSLWMASLRPLLDPREFDSNPQTVARVFIRDPQLGCLYRAAFDTDPVKSAARDGESVVANVGKALAAFQETLWTGRTPFDDFRDALARGDRKAAARYPAAALRGLRLFIGAGQCSLCHSGPEFSNGEFADIGIPFFVRPGEVDPGRFGGIRRLRDSPFNQLGRHTGHSSEARGLATRHLHLEPRLFGEFRVPSLRNVATTAPYMHNGSLDTLRDVVRHYSGLDESRIHGSAQPLLRALALSKTQIDDLLAFLDSLTDAPGARRPMPAPRDIAACPAPE